MPSFPSTIFSATAAGFPAGTAFSNSARCCGDDFGRDALAIQVDRLHRGDVHRDVAAQLDETFVARDEVGLAVDLDEHADLAAGMDVARDAPFIGDALGLFLGAREALLGQRTFCRFVVAAGFHEGIAAIDHAAAGFFAEAFDVVGAGFVVCRVCMLGSDLFGFVRSRVVRAFCFGVARDDRIGDLRDHQLNGANCVVVAGDKIVNLIGVAVGVDHGDDRNFQLAGLEDGDAFFLGIDDEQRVGKTVHVLDPAQKPLQLVELFGKLRDFFLGKQIERALLTHPFEFAQTRDALLDGRKVRERSAEPTLVDEERAAAFGFFFNSVLGLLLGADEQDDFVRARPSL